MQVTTVSGCFITQAQITFKKIHCKVNWKENSAVRTIFPWEKVYRKENSNWKDSRTYTRSYRCSGGNVPVIEAPLEEEEPPKEEEIVLDPLDVMMVMVKDR
ncbi:hypothetical protein EB796_003164 [Bugula neritina]|uniref:Uncharacterized protein n=1 Tax=Bugula neritina TaxID=10212 RepID=A0A7J7KJS8_BUGNE|nr:hypothetical protein EB796_003164 [Bugula neritina]